MSAWNIELLLQELSEAYAKEGGLANWEQEKEPVMAALKHLANILGTGGQYQAKRVLGVGGSGIAIRVHDKKFPAADKALKFPRPVPGKVEFVAAMLEKEISHLSDLRHHGIVRIIQYDIEHQVGSYERLPYYIMDYVDGAASQKFAQSADFSSADLHRLLITAAETLRYLHDHPPGGVAHLDLKPDNLMVDATGAAVMIDLGTCKQIDHNEANTVVSVTKSFAHPRLVQRLVADPTDENRSRGELKRSEIEPAWDLWSFGLTMLIWLGLDPETGQVHESGVYHRIDPYRRKYYLLLAARLQEFSPRQWLLQRIGLPAGFIKEFPVTNAAALLDLLMRLDGSASPLGRIPELQEGQLQTFQAGPELHVPLTDRLQAVLESEPVRRLNSISQLGLVSQVYMGAKHSRREHSIGTYANASRILKTLYSDPYSPLFRQIISPEDCEDVLLTALLHDTGQFPLAHDLEDVAPNIFDHDELSRAILKGKWDKKKKGSRPVVMPDITAVLEAWRTTPERVDAIMSAKASSTNHGAREKLLRSIISSAIDADKLDYLLRDARQTNVPYPFGIDVERLYRSLTIVVVKNQPGGKSVPTIGVHAKGKVAAEFLTWSRYAMFSQVYWHHAVRAQKAMLNRAVAALLAGESADEGTYRLQADFIEFVTALPGLLFEQTEPGDPELFPSFDRHASTPNPGQIATELTPTDAATVHWFRTRLKDKELPEAGLAEMILRRQFFKRLWVLSHDFNSAQWDRIITAWDKLQPTIRNKAAIEFEQLVAKHARKGKLVSVTNMKAEDADDLLQEWTAAQVPWLLIDVPGGRPGSDLGLHYVLEGQRRALKKNDRAVGEEIISEVWIRYARDLREVAGKIRIFCNPMVADVLEESISFEEGMELLIEALEGQSW